jgi:hypothetical protein
VSPLAERLGHGRLGTSQREEIAVSLLTGTSGSCLRADTADRLGACPDLFGAQEQAVCAMARLDQALDGHPLRPAFLYRARLEAVRRQAAVDGQNIDPWHLAATLEGLRLRMEGALRIIDRGAILAGARAALALHRWITEPDVDQEGQIQAAERHLETAGPTILLGAAEGFRSWLRGGGTRPPARAARVRPGVNRGLLRAPVPLTGARALGTTAPEGHPAWACSFLIALTDEALDFHQLLRDLERAWLAARARGAGKRSTSRAGLAVDLLAAAPLMSATTLARAIGMSIKGATALLDGFVADGIAVEVTHRSARRLFGLSGMAPLREATTPPHRPEPGRGRGRPPLAPRFAPHFAPDVAPEDAALPSSPSLPPVVRFERPAIDYAALAAGMAQCDQVIRDARRRLAGISTDAPPTRPAGEG